MTSTAEHTACQYSVMRSRAGLVEISLFIGRVNETLFHDLFHEWD